jgi:AAA family ATP:ADP antiporter
LILNIVNTTGEFILSEYVDNAAESAAHAGDIDEGAFIGHFYGEYFLWVNVAALVLQAFVVSRVVKYLGLRGVLFALPIVAFGSYGLFAAGVGLGVARWAKTAENATDYSIMNTGKALLWLPTTREEKYKAKQAVDTLFVRIGDLVAALMFLVATAAFSANMHALALVNMGFVAVWLVLTIFVVRRHDQRVRDSQARDGEGLVQ